ncbi:two-component SAPR family response regulator [Anaerotaenia torta]|uniref:response regulator n=1 Tax=Anaerotaenia torta TaxID=433293 RepID=UPI003D21C456
MKVILVDDEVLALEVLERLLMKIDGIEICGKYTDAGLALMRLEDRDIDVIFLDMEMGRIHGLKFAEELLSRNIPSEIVFVTAYSQYAIDAFEVEAIDYLLKPVSADRLQMTVNRLKERLRRSRNNDSGGELRKGFLMLHTFGSLQVYFEGTSGSIPIRWRTKKVKELFCYLWQNREYPINKYRIMEELWPEIDADRGGALLHTTVYQLRKVLRELGYENGIQFRNDQYQLEIPLKSDLDELRSLLDNGEPSAKEIKELLELYTGDYLDQEEYSWSIYLQQTIKNTYLKYLKWYVIKNMDCRSGGTLLESCLMKMIQLDPYDEEYNYLLMNYYAGEGNAKGAIKVYEEHCRNLKEELGLRPSLKIMAFYREFIKNK